MSAEAREIIRAARADDFAEVAVLLSRSSLPLEGVPKTMAGYIVAVEGDMILGVGGIETCDRFSLLRSVAVNELARNRGIGRKIVERLVADERSKGRDAIYLLTTTADGYFPMLGFTKVDRGTIPSVIRATQQFTDTCPSTATVMKLDLHSK